MRAAAGGAAAGEEQVGGKSYIEYPQGDSSASCAGSFDLRPAIHETQ